MIRYQISKQELIEAIDAAAPTWRHRAAERTSVYVREGRYVVPPTSIWSDIKRVYMTLQGSKCGFCERRLEHSEYGNVEHDVEHFRPKANVSAWRPPTTTGQTTIKLDLGAAATTGYHLLAHHHDNYLIACKTCNTAFKQNGFPVNGVRQLDLADPRSTVERPWLVYPVGGFDEDPQRLIRFEGIVPVPVTRSGPRRNRARVIIEFFGLAERDGLLLERAIAILSLHLALESSDHSDQLTQSIARQLVATLTSDGAAHANCSRSFVKLWADDQGAARHFSEAALALVSSTAPAR